MNLNAISIKNLMRRKGKAAFVLAGLVIGVSTVVGILSYVEAMTNDINHKLEKYGANILIVPKTENLALSYGGLSLGGVSFEMEEIRQKDLGACGNDQEFSQYCRPGATGPRRGGRGPAESAYGRRRFSGGTNLKALVENAAGRTAG